MKDIENIYATVLVTMIAIAVIFAIFMIGKINGERDICSYIKNEHTMTSVPIPEFTYKYCSNVIKMD